jgi:methyltransferase (TIGR00027 family)
MDTLGMTALGMAAVRAAENDREDRLFDDPYAQLFLDAMPAAFPLRWSSGTASLGAMFASHGAIRTRFFDDYLLGSGCQQIVLLAAGLDTRAFRLTWPHEVRLFEIELPDVLAFKEPVLAGRETRCERRTVAADLRADWPMDLIKAGFDPDTRTAWLAEGLLIYLSADDAARVFEAVGELSSPGSRLAFEHDSSASPLVDEARSVPAMAEFAKLWKGGLGPDAPAWLAGHGWCVQAHHNVSYERSERGVGFLTAEFDTAGFDTAEFDTAEFDTAEFDGFPD